MDEIKNDIQIIKAERQQKQTDSKYKQGPAVIWYNYKRFHDVSSRIKKDKKSDK